MSNFVKSTDNSQILGVAGGSLNINSGVTIGGTLNVTGAVTTGALTASSFTNTGLLTASNGFTVTTGTITLPSGSVANASLVSAVPTLAGANTFSNAGTAIAVTNNATIGGTLSVTGAITTGALTASSATSTGLLTASNGLTVTTGTITLPSGSVANASLVSAVPTLAGANTFSNAGTAIAVTNNATIGGTLNVTGATTLGSLTVTGTETDTGILTCSSALVTQGLVYEVVGTAGQSTNALTLNYSLSGLVNVGTMITLNATLAVTNIPTDTTKSYTFSVAYQQTSTRYYIATVQFQDTGSAYITNGGTSGFVAPMFNGGTPALTIPEPPAPPTKYLNYTRIYRKVVNKVIQRSTVISTECHIISIICHCN